MLTQFADADALILVQWSPTPPYPNTASHTLTILVWRAKPLTNADKYTETTREGVKAWMTVQIPRQRYRPSPPHRLSSRPDRNLTFKLKFTKRSWQLHPFHMGAIHDNSLAHWGNFSSWYHFARSFFYCESFSGSGSLRSCRLYWLFDFFRHQSSHGRSSRSFGRFHPLCSLQ